MVLVAEAKVGLLLGQGQRGFRTQQQQWRGLHLRPPAHPLPSVEVDAGQKPVAVGFVTAAVSSAELPGCL